MYAVRSTDNAQYGQYGTCKYGMQCGNVHAYGTCKYGIRDAVPERPRLQNTGRDRTGCNVQVCNVQVYSIME